jgi:predicted Rossmann fold nucleotide-binding protein DprA/Smf involved in DNA uptake
MTGRQILIYLSLKYKGDWNSIYTAIKEKEFVDSQSVNTIKLDCDVVTIIDPHYPDLLKTTHKPPFVLFYKGSLQYLHHYNLVGVIGNNATDKQLQIINHRLNVGVDDDTKVVSVSSLPIKDLKLASNNLLISEYYNASAKDAKSWATRLLVGLSKVLISTTTTLTKAHHIAIGYAMYHNKHVLFANKTHKDFPTITDPEELHTYMRQDSDTINEEFLPEGFA